MKLPSRTWPRPRSPTSTGWPAVTGGRTLSPVKRATTLSGLLVQALRVRWAALGGPAKLLVVVGLLLGAALTFHVGACFLGGCPAMNSSPCSRADVSDEPCPLRRAAEPAPADLPCHLR